MSSRQAIEGKQLCGFTCGTWHRRLLQIDRVNQRTSADITALDGNENTFAIYDTRETTSPMAEAVFALWQIRTVVLYPIRGADADAL